MFLKFKQGEGFEPVKSINPLRKMMKEVSDDTLKNLISTYMYLSNCSKTHVCSFFTFIVSILEKVLYYVTISVTYKG